jgi:hypothetical protein
LIVDLEERHPDGRSIIPKRESDASLSSDTKTDLNEILEKTGRRTSLQATVT